MLLERWDNVYVFVICGVNSASTLLYRFEQLEVALASERWRVRKWAPKKPGLQGPRSEDLGFPRTPSPTCSSNRLK